MLAKHDGLFNVSNTNGRRSDLLNAMTIGLSIIADLDKEFPSESWARYPYSTKQYEFYKRTIEASPEVFKQHAAFDEISKLIERNKVAFHHKDENFAKAIGLFPYKSSNPVYKNFDTNIESRARHYTSTLHKLGFVDNGRNITQAGRDYLSQNIKKDKLEALLPINNVNVVMLRQLFKMRVYIKEDDGTYSYYNPGLYCLCQLLSGDTYSNEELSIAVLTHSKTTSTSSFPKCFTSSDIVPHEDFKQYIKSQKSNISTQYLYYNFYLLMYKFAQNQCKTTYDALIDFCKLNDYNGIKGAFLMSTPLTLNVRGKWLSFNEFQAKNKNSEWLRQGSDFNSFFYKQHIASKSKRLLKEYGDTLFRLLTCTGVFSFSKALPLLLYKDVFKEVVSYVDVENLICGTVSEEEYQQYETEYGNTHSLTEIFNLSQETIEKITNTLREKYGDDIKKSLSREKADQFAKHIEKKYPREKVIELLSCLSDRKNDAKIQEYVSKSADIPTICEFLLGIAWYYLSGKDFSLFDSFNLTLDGNFEPVHHAAGGAGDIVIEYPDKVIMLEVTLMNKSAQKRGELEPVIRHATNLKAENEDKQVTTFFIADELDTNTINTWRSAALWSLEATTSKAQTTQVYIMPLTISDICGFLKNNTKSEDIINAARKSYDDWYDACVKNNAFASGWRNEILKSIAEK